MSGQPGLTIGTSSSGRPTVTGTANAQGTPPDANGTVQLTGEFDGISFLASPVDGSTQDDIVLQVGAPPAATPAAELADPAFNGGRPVELSASPSGNGVTSFDDVFVDGRSRTIAGGNLQERINSIGGTDRSGLIARLRPDGSPDGGFGGGDGLATPDYGDATTMLKGVLRDPSGRLGAGFLIPFGSVDRLVAARYADNGTEDPGYDADGTAFADATAAGDGGRVLVARVLGGADGSTTFIGDDNGFGSTTRGRLRVVRLAADGRLDSGFGTAGRAAVLTPSAPVPSGRTAPNVTGGTVLPDGRVLVVGRTYDANGRAEMFVTRLTSAGQPDTTFGGAGDGTLRIQADTPGGGGDSSGSQAKAVAVAPDGTLFVVGETFSGASVQGAVVTHLSAGGVLDPAFGVVRTPASRVDTSDRREAEASAVAVQSNGQPVVAITVGDGFTRPLGRPRLVVARFTASGALDPSFAGDGVAQETRLPAAQAQQMAIAPGGRLVVAGAAGTASNGLRSGFVTRYVVQDAGSLRIPEAVRDPVVSGTPSPGRTLRCVPAQWTNSPTSIETLWERAPRGAVSADDPSWGPIGATGTSYVLTQDDLGSRVRCREVATNADGSATAPSDSKRVDAGIPAVQVAPTVTGTPVVRLTLTCDVGQWTGGPDFAVQWYREVSGPIAGATNRTYVPQDNGQSQQIGCEVTASNDVGAAAPVRTAPTLVFNAPPRSISRPTATLEPSLRLADTRFRCAPGRWDEDTGDYEYRWRREGAEIAGQTEASYTPTVADLGRLIACEVFSTNPAGRSEGARSDEVLLPLPTFGTSGKVFQAGGFNRYDPRNFLALSANYLEAIRGIVIKRQDAAVVTRRAFCGRVFPNRPAVPTFPAQTGPDKLMTLESTCGVLLGAPAAQVVTREGGAYWRGGTCSVPQDDTTSFAAFSAPRCPRLFVSVARIDPAHPPAVDIADQARLDAAKPLVVLWDFNRDGRADASCDPDAPVVRSLFNSGSYTASAVVVTEDGVQSGIYSLAQLDFTHAQPGNGNLRAAQPFACRASIDPPAEPNLPCVPKASIGRMVLEGDLCPISLRRIPEKEVEQLPRDVQDALQNQATNADLRVAPPAPERSPFGAALRAAPGSTAYDTAVQINALSTLGQADAATAATRIPKKWEKSLKATKGFDYDKRQFALDQIYMMAGRTKVNGVDVVPSAGTAAVLIPSDAGEAIDSVKKMRLSASNAATSLGGVPLGDPALLAADLADKVGVAPPTLKDVNLDALAAKLKSKLDLGPFKLAGRTKLRLADGTAFLDARAELPNLQAKPGSSPIRTAVTVRADKTGRVKLQGVHLEVKSAYLAALKIADLKLDYDGGLAVQGKLLFPPLDEGIAINKFRLDDRGRFRELDVDYLAGRGQGIGIGPGLFLTKIGGGLSLSPDEIRARATISAGPSATGGGCPTAGIEAAFTVHFAPGVFFVRADGTVSLLCIPLGNASFYADQTGAVDIGARVNLDLGPLFFEAGIGGSFRLPRWQLEARGKGGVRHIFTAEVKALVGNLGIAGCGRVELFPATPLTDSITVAAGAGVRFSGGRPPLSFPELIANVRAFTGCDLSGWSPFGRDVSARAAQAGGGRTFTVRKPVPTALALELFGRGGPSRVRLRSPSGKLLDATALSEDL